MGPVQILPAILPRNKKNKRYKNVKRTREPPECQIDVWRQQVYAESHRTAQSTIDTIILIPT